MADKKSIEITPKSEDKIFGRNLGGKDKPFRIAHQKLLLTYPHKLDKESVKNHIVEQAGDSYKIAVIEVSHQGGNESYPRRTHVLVDFSKAFQTRDITRFDIEREGKLPLRPKIRTVNNKRQWNNCMKYLINADPILKGGKVKTVSEITDHSVVTTEDVIVDKKHEYYQQIINTYNLIADQQLYRIAGYIISKKDGLLIVEKNEYYCADSVKDLPITHVWSFETKDKVRILGPFTAFKLERQFRESKHHSNLFYGEETARYVNQTTYIVSDLKTTLYREHPNRALTRVLLSNLGVTSANVEMMLDNNWLLQTSNGKVKKSQSDSKLGRYYQDFCDQQERLNEDFGYYTAEIHNRMMEEYNDPDIICYTLDIEG